MAQATRAAQAGVDVIIAQGTEAGGHTGLDGTLALVPAVVDVVGDIPVSSDDTELLAQMRELAARHPRYGYRRMSVLLRRTAQVNEKRVRRLWRQHRLQVQRVRRRRVRLLRPLRPAAVYLGHTWAYAVVEDALADGTPLRILTVMGKFAREGLAIGVALTTSAERVIGVLTALVAQYGAPAYLRSDNGAECIATAVQLRLTQCGIPTLYIDPGKLWQSGKGEHFNGTVPAECLNRQTFYSVAEICVRLSIFRHHYNHERPHSRLGYLIRHLSL